MEAMDKGGPPVFQLGTEPGPCSVGTLVNYLDCKFLLFCQVST